MNIDANLGERELLDEDYLTIDRIPIVSEGRYAETTFANADNLDESDIDDEFAVGALSMGGAVGTQHRYN